MFTLHPQLAKDSFVVGEFTVCLLLLINDSQYPWCILVPQREAVRELYELDAATRVQVLEESCTLAATMQRLFSADKMNVAALGNVVPQLHIHHIARVHTDPAWPLPVWGKCPARPYADAERDSRLQQLRAALFSK
jgi:diadenosine tetraphosphate (Ap4A) HIT family hydrolase